TEPQPLSLHDALPILSAVSPASARALTSAPASRRDLTAAASPSSTARIHALVSTGSRPCAVEAFVIRYLLQSCLRGSFGRADARSEEHTSELQSRGHL